MGARKLDHGVYCKWWVSPAISKAMDVLPKTFKDFSVATLKRLSGILGGILHSAYFPFRKKKSLWVLLADSNNICFFPKVAFMDRVEAISIASSAII
ncbi:hypothetical protein Bca52824_042481 [Brassica carinata]|uniref:Uncharacterized protein n=1 Tax=Brassica carinata TaxID=52824 RepID=A0A8X7RXI3_BRACI|nr:hypothetical protein Bca52824_042481 [Brassica carinata]